MRTDANWIETFTGVRFWPTDPRPGDVDIRDIAHALSNLCRFTGHTRRFYSVAQHSVRVMKALGPGGTSQLRLWALLHDSSEAYIMDLSRPVKYLPELYGYRNIEDNLERFISGCFGLFGRCPEIIKLTDSAVLLQEKKELLRNLVSWEAGGAKVWDVVESDICVQPERANWPKVAELRFLYHYHRLQGEIRGLSGVKLYADAICRLFRR